MSRRRRDTFDPRQTAWSWNDAHAVLAAAPEGDVLYDVTAPAASRLSAPRPRRAARATGRHTQPPPSLGLPLGTVELEGRLTCWACACALDPTVLARSPDGPEPPRCDGCGARLPVR